MGICILFDNIYLHYVCDNNSVHTLHNYDVTNIVTSMHWPGPSSTRVIGKRESLTS